MATSLASQLQAIRSVTQVDSEARKKRPITRPSILFPPKEAADVDTDTIFTVAVSGLEVLVTVDDRFSNYKSDLFSHKSKELDRELLPEEENKRINSLIASYLRLLSGHLELPASLKTLEYLIRRYKVQVYNMEDLVLCALPYHDTHVFVQIVQLLDIRNGTWKFLEGVKTSGAPPPRHVLVQQCKRDMGVLEALCNYASPAKKYQPSRPVVSLCTAVVVEALGSLATVDSDVVKRILPFVSYGLQAGSRGNSDLKASAFMIISLLSRKVPLSPKLVKSLIRSITEIACGDAKDPTDLQWLRLAMMALINVVQFQSVDLLPKKALETLKETRDILETILELSYEYNIDKFLHVFLESLIEYSPSDEASFLIAVICTFPLKRFVDHIVSKVLSSCKKASQRKNDQITASGSWAKKSLMVLNEKYPSEFGQSVQQFFEDNKVQSVNDDTHFEILCAVMDGGQDFSAGILDSKTWFALYHPKSDIRCPALRGLNALGIMKAKDASLQMPAYLKDIMLSQLYDGDLAVVQAALAVEGLTELLNPSDLVKALKKVLGSCISTLMSSSPDKKVIAHDVAVSFLGMVVSKLDKNAKIVEEVAATVFPFLLILPKTRSLNLKVVELAKEIPWKFYQNLIVLPNEENKNMKIVDGLAETFLADPDEYMPWLIKSSEDVNTAKTLFLMVLMQAFVRAKDERQQFPVLFDASFAVLRREWESCESSDDSLNEVARGTLHRDGKNFLDQLLNADCKTHNKTILICIFWRLLECLVTISEDNYTNWAGSRLRELFSFFASYKHVFKEHLQDIVKNCNMCPADFLSSFFTQEDVSVAVLVESLNCFSFIYNDADDRVLVQVLANFPSLLVPLASDCQEVKLAAMSCAERLYALSHHINSLSKKNGNNASWYNFLDDLLGVIVQQKRLILSDKSFLTSLLTSLLGSSHDSLQVPTNIEQRFDQSSKEKIVAFILSYALRLSNSAKLTIITLFKGLGSKIMYVKDVQPLLAQLLERRNQCHQEADDGCPKLTESEVEILCILLEICCMPSPLLEGPTHEDFLLRALQLDGLSLDDRSVSRPCIAVLAKLNDQFYSCLSAEKQELLLRELVILFRCNCADIQNATRQALLRLNITWSIVVATLDVICKRASHSSGSLNSRKKKKLVKHQTTSSSCDPISNRETTLCSLSSLLDVLMLKKDISNRGHLVGPLFELLGRIFSNEFGYPQDEKQIETSSVISESNSSKIYFVKQSLFLLLEDIIGSIAYGPAPEGEAAKVIDIQSLVQYAISEKDGVTRNHIILLLTTIAKVIPEKILEHLVDILTVIGESTITQIDSYSRRVFEDFISSVVPYWLAKTNNSEKLLQIFVNVLHDVADHRRQSIIVLLLRNLGEQNSLAPLVVLLFRSLVARKGVLCLDESTASSESSITHGEWEFAFALQIYEQYSCTTWLPSLVTLIEMIESSELRKEVLMELLYVLEFVSQKLQDPELVLKLESSEDSERIQAIVLSAGTDMQMTLQKLMEHVLPLSLVTNSKAKQKDIPVTIRKRLKECMDYAVRRMTKSISPSGYFRGITNLLCGSNELVKKKVLGHLSETIKYRASVRTKHKGKANGNSRLDKNWFPMDDGTWDYYRVMCVEILQIVDNSMDETYSSLKMSAVATIESLAQSFPSDHSVYSLCLSSVAKGIDSSSLAVTSSCLRATGALVNVLGAKALSELPQIMKNVTSKCSNNFEQLTVKTKNACDGGTSSLLESTLITLEALVDKLGGFLSPYLGDIIELLVLGSEYTSEAKPKLKLKADVVRRLLAERIPIRLALPPVLKIYSDAVSYGDSSVAITFKMLESLIARMDRSSIGTYHGKIFEFCLSALDLRHQHNASIHNIDDVEKNVVNAMISLTMKLTEKMFKPLFIRAIEWSESNVDDSFAEIRGTLDRNISLYHLVNGLAENHRSLFVPYFKYLLEGCVWHLTSTGDAKGTGLSRKKKKAKVQEGGTDQNEGLNSLLNWQLRALVISALHKCFLHDTGAVKFLDASNFQLLLKPIVSQLVIEPPALLEAHPNIPSLKEVDDMLVVCIGQMAVTAGTDLLWKPLNHEVLLQTRSGKVRSRILGLRTVKYFVDHLKEEYLVFLAETIPYLAELLEDVELPVKSLAQDILKEMESMSGESLRQYLL